LVALASSVVYAVAAIGAGCAERDAGSEHGGYRDAAGVLSSGSHGWRVWPVSCCVMVVVLFDDECVELVDHHPSLAWLQSKAHTLDVHVGALSAQPHIGRPHVQYHADDHAQLS
jgi:hypothetical protein